MNKLKPVMPHGQVVNSINGIVYLERGYIRHEDSKAKQLEKIRAYASVRPPQPSLLTTKKYRAIASAGKVREHREQMRTLRDQIDASLAHLSMLDSRPPKRSALKRSMRALAKGVAVTAKVGILSRPGKKPDIKGAMQAPFRPGAPKGKGKSGTPAELLGERKIRERKGASILQHANYLQQRAEEQYRYGPGAREQELKDRLQILQPYRNAVSVALQGVQKAKTGIDDAAEKVNQALLELPQRIAKRKDGLRRKKEQLAAAKGKPREAIEEAEHRIWRRVSVKYAKTGSTQRDKELDSAIRSDEEEIGRLKKMIMSEEQMITLEEEIGSLEEQIAREENEGTDQELDAARQRLGECKAAHDDAIADLKQVLVDIAQDGQEAGSYQKSLNDKIAALRPQEVKDSDQVLALEQKVREILDDRINGITYQLKHPNSHLVRDLGDARKNLERSKELVREARDYIEKAEKKDKPALETVKEKIARLDGFETSTTSDTGEQEEIGESHQNLQTRFTELYKHLCDQQEPKNDELDNEIVFDLVYGAVAGALASGVKDADPQRAAEALAELANPDFSLRDLAGDMLSEDARLVVQAIAVLPRGMEILQRMIPADDVAQIVAPPGKQDKEAALQKILALQTCLRAGKALSDLGDAINDSTRQLLEGARAATRKLYDNPRAELSDAERASYAAVRNRLTDTAPDSNVQYVSDRLAKVVDEWLPRALERENTILGRIGQGGGSGAGKVKNLLPTTGKAPISSTTIAAAERTSTAYGVDPVKTGARIDDYALKSASTLRDVAIALLEKGAPPEGMKDLLITVAAAQVARDKIAAAAKEGRELRPEHCIVGGQLSKQELLDTVNARVQEAFKEAELFEHGSPPDAISQAIQSAINTAILKEAPDTHELIAVAMHAANEAMWSAGPGVSSAERKLFLERLDLASAFIEAAGSSASASADIKEVKAKLKELEREAGLDGALDKLCDKVSYPLPPVAIQPLKAESLIQCKSSLTGGAGVAIPDVRHKKGEKDGGLKEKDVANEAGETEAGETEAGEAAAAMAKAREGAKAAIDKAIAQTERLEHLIDMSAPAQLNTKEDIYAYLLKKFEQFELRGKLRLSSGGVLGVSTKSISDAISSINWIGGVGSVSPRLRLEGLGGRNAIFEINMSTVGFEIFIGTEKRTSATAGLGIGGRLGITAARGSGAVDKSVTRDAIVQEGVKFMIPRSPTKAYSDNDMRVEAKKLLDTIFHWKAPDNDTGELGGLPGNLGAILAACPHVSVAVAGKQSDQSLRQESAVSVSFSSKGKLPSDGKSMGVSLTGGGKNTHLNWREFNISEQTGLHNVERHNLAYGGQVTVNARVAPTATVASMGHDLKNSLSVRSTGVSTTRQIRIAGADVKLRVVTIDGKTHAVNTRKDREHTNAVTLRQSIEENREQWIQLGIDQLFKKPEDKNIPIEEKRRFVNDSLERAIRVCEKSERSEGGNLVLRNVFAESFRLTDSASAQLDGFRSEEALLDARIARLDGEIRAIKASGDSTRVAEDKEAREKLKQARQEKVRLMDAQNALFQEEASWQPWKVTASERTQETEQAGLDILVKAGATDASEGQRPILSWPV
jgi:hypothetical protein